MRSPVWPQAIIWLKPRWKASRPSSRRPSRWPPGNRRALNIAMAIETAQQSVTVSETATQVNTEASGNVSSIVIKDKDLDALSEDPDDLANELSALAGPSVGPSGGQMYIDGFSNGTLPPKSAIKEIRINSNPFSAEYDRPGFGRIEIITKPGADKLRGRLFSQGNDNVFNTGNPFTRTFPLTTASRLAAASAARSQKAPHTLSMAITAITPTPTSTTPRPALTPAATRFTPRAASPIRRHASAYRPASISSSAPRTPLPCATRSTTAPVPTASGAWAARAQPLCLPRPPIPRP